MSEAADALQNFDSGSVGTVDEFDEINTVADEIDTIADELEQVEFPGMYG